MKKKRVYVDNEPPIWFYRKNVWKSNLEDIHKHNTGVMKGLQSYLMGINRFTKLVSNVTVTDHNRHNASHTSCRAI